ncbi:MAG: hypothetical protein HYX56_06890 [Chloroflexi bacterium]|nr:hypothetical protein [Chloroflexota bacterium]
MADRNDLIHYVCTAPSHRRTADLGLTRNGERWALCPDLIGRDHEWQDTGGLEVSAAVARWQELVGLGARAAA